ncbi:MAG: glycerophosphodiester phosphodiesterase [Planctomycetes bacterium]|nr:glycerophosphodiester phosphodiesterase [Planctomycetota bacterium]
MSTWPYPRLIAHRGGAHLAPENTLPAFAEAARRGYRGIECDVVLTADGVPVLMHDDTLERTAGGRGRVIDHTLAQLAGLDAGAWFHPRFAGTRIPTLEQAIAAWQADGQQALIELKGGAGQDPRRLGRTCAELVARVWRGQPPMFISFTSEALVAAAEAAPHIPRALLLGCPWNEQNPWPADWRARLAAARATALDIDHTLVTPERVAEAHAEGVALLAWTVDDPARAATLLAWGVDGIAVDAIDKIRP